MENGIQQARRLLRSQRQLLDDGKTFGCLCAPFRFRSKEVYSYEEVNTVLASVVDSDGPIDVIKALLSLGADVNFFRRQDSRAWNTITLRPHQGYRSNLLLRATVQCRHETVRLLAAHADQENLDSVLRYAIVRGDVAVLQALLDRGANPTDLHDDFQNAVFQDQLDIVRALLSGHRLPCLSCRSIGLRIAVKNKSFEIMELLLKCWADINHDGASALVKAVELSRPDIVSLLTSGPIKASPRSLDAALGKVAELMTDKVSSDTLEMLGMCLSLGASGAETDRMLTEGVLDAVKQDRIELLDTILRLRRIPAKYEGLALQQAVRSERTETIIKLLQFSPSSSSLTVAVSQAMQIADSRARFQTIRLLIDAGAQEEFTAGALVQVVQIITKEEVMGKVSGERSLFDLLLHDGRADVNYDGGRALQVAVQALSVPLAESIIAKVPSADTLGAVLPWAISIPDRDIKQDFVQMLLQNPVNQDAVGNALVETFKGGSEHLSLIRLLLARASVNHNNGEVFIFAIRNFEPAAFCLLLVQSVSYNLKALFTTIMEALRAPWETRSLVFGLMMELLGADHLNASLKFVVLEERTDLDLVRMLLDAGADVLLEGGVCLKNAASKLDLELLHLLAKHSGKDELIFTQALSGIVTQGRQWIAQEHIELIQLLLHYGASGQVLDEAMLEVVDHLACRDDERHLRNILLNILFAAKADVNYQQGKAIAVAATKGDVSLLSHLLSHNTTMAATFNAMSSAILARHKEHHLVELLGAFANRRASRTEIRSSLPHTLDPVMLCLKSYPNSATLVGALVKAGCSLDATVPMHVSSERLNKDGRRLNPKPEPVSILMWALLEIESGISPDVLRALIRYGADASYTTPRTRTTPLLLAAKSGKREAVRILLESGARASSRDVLGRSALFFASQSGDAELVALLLKSGPSTNDGSLHEAARGFHIETIKLLLSAGHDPNFRSTRHNGLTALGELARHATVPEDATPVEKTLDILRDAGASPLLKAHGKTVIFLALDNPDNVRITRPLLEKVLLQTINSQENTFQHGVYNFSPTTYVSKGILQGPQSVELYRMLRGYGVENHFYANMGETQPTDAVGLPEEIMEHERLRRRELPSEEPIPTEKSTRHHSDISHQRDVRRQNEPPQRSSPHGHAKSRSLESGLARGRQQDDLTVAHHRMASASPARQGSSRSSSSQEKDGWSEKMSNGQRKKQQKHEKLYEQDVLLAEKEMREMYHVRDRHESKMTMLKTHRGNVIGQVDLEELKRWHERDEYIRGG
ncbi:Inversin [Podospora conica]|nr:Inversin [Schizothecium conicum]